MNDARSLAVTALCETERRDAYADALITDFLNTTELNEKDTALASRIFYGVLQNRIYLDRLLGLYCKKPFTTLHPKLRNILRCAAYQIVFCDKIPDSAAVNEAVKQTKIMKMGYASGLCNAILRKVCTNKTYQPDFENDTDRLSVVYSHPRKLVDLLKENVPQTEAFLKANNQISDVFVRVNPLRSNPSEIAGKYASLGAKAVFEGCVSFPSGSFNPILSEEYRNGLFSIQDPASYLAVRVLDPQPGELIVDGAAAPGGKSMAAAELSGNKADIRSFDIYENKLELIRKNAERCGLTCIHTAVNDASVPQSDLIGQCDGVIADLPCSGFGIIRKKPDIRYRNLEDTESLPDLQYKLLTSLSEYVKPGGRLVYSTCTVLKRENEDVVRRFLDQNRDFNLSPFHFGNDPLFDAPDGMITLYPHIHGTDGFFISLLVRKE